MWYQLQHQHPMWVLVHILAVILPTQLLDKELQKAMEDVPYAWAPATPTWETDEAPGFDLAQP